MPQPKNIAAGSLEMSIKQLLQHMVDTRVNHCVLVIPGSELRVAVTLADPLESAAITEAVQRIME